MDPLDEHIKEQIEQYLLGKMPKAEAVLFESGMQADPVLQQEVDMQRNIIAAIKHARKQELKEYIRVNTRPGIATGTSGLKQMYWYAAAATVLLIVISITYLNVLRPNGNKESKDISVSKSTPIANEGLAKSNTSADTTTKLTAPQNESKMPVEGNSISKAESNQTLATRKSKSSISDTLVVQNKDLAGNTYAWSTAPKQDEKLQDKNRQLNEGAVQIDTKSVNNLPSAYNNNMGSSLNTVSNNTYKSYSDNSISNAPARSAKKAKSGKYAGKKEEEAKSTDDASRPFAITGSIIKDTVMFPIMIADNTQESDNDNLNKRSDSSKTKNGRLKDGSSSDSKATTTNHKVIVSYIISPQQKDDYIFNGNWLYVYNEPMKNAVLYNLNGVIYMKKNRIVYELKQDSKIHREIPVSNKKILAKFGL